MTTLTEAQRKKLVDEARDFLARNGRKIGFASKCLLERLTNALAERAALGLDEGSPPTPSEIDGLAIKCLIEKLTLQSSGNVFYGHGLCAEAAAALKAMQGEIERVAKVEQDSMLRRFERLLSMTDREKILVEAARAIAEEQFGEGCPLHPEEDRSLAEAAFSVFIKHVLREPSEEMLAVCEAGLDEAYNGNKDDPGCTYGIKKVLRAAADHLEAKEGT